MAASGRKGEPLLRQNVAVLFSESTRLANIAEARQRGETYTFTDARGTQREWLKGQYAYLAPNAATTLLNRFNVKHDIVSEDAIAGGVPPAYRALFVPNASPLDQRAIVAIESWITESGCDERRLIVTGRTNLPPALLGLAAAATVEPEGYTGWQFRPDSPFADRAVWEDAYLTSYRGYAAVRATATPKASVLAGLCELPSARAAATGLLGDAIVVTDRTLFIANQVLEYMGGAMQAHVNVDDLRDRYNTTHYLDTIGYLLRELLCLLGLGDLFATQLRSFGVYEGMVVLRHDADVAPEEALDLSMLQWQRANQVPATYVVLDPVVSPEHTNAVASKTWAEEAGRTNLMEVGLHNDGCTGSPPTYVAGRALCDHIVEGDRRLGITSATVGRHYGFHRHPETLDAMEYLYDQAPSLVGMCTFSVLQVIEYGVHDPAVTWLGRSITYSTRYRADGWTSGAVTGWWFPHHVVVTTADRHRTLRGWDSTKESECDFDRIDELLASRNTKDPAQCTRLPNPVITVQYHPQSANSASVNDGQGSLPWVRYLCLAAERQGFGLATKRTIYERLNDYETVLFRAEPDGEIVVANPSDRTITGLMVRVPGPIRAVTSDELACVHIVGGDTSTLPPLPSGCILRLRPSADGGGLPVITQPNTMRLEIVSAVHERETGETRVTVRAIARSNLILDNLPPGQRVEVLLSGMGDQVWQREATDEGRLVLPIGVPADAFTTLHLTVGPRR